MAELFANGAKGRLLSGITSGALSLTLRSGQGTPFPSWSAGDFSWVTIEQGPAANPTKREIVQATAKSSDTLTIVRGQQDTSAVAFDPGARVELRLTAETLNAFKDQIGFNRRYPRSFFGPNGQDAGATVPDGWGVLELGTGTGSTKTNGTLSTADHRQSMIRIDVSGTGAVGLITLTADAQVGIIGSASAIGGFELVMRWGISLNNTNSRMVLGLNESAAAFPTNTTDPSSMTTRQFIGFGWNAADATTDNIKLFHCDGGGVVTSVDTGVTRDTTSVLQLRFFAPRGRTSVYVELHNITTGSRFTRTLTSNIPSITMPLYWQPTVGGSAGCGFSMMGTWLF